MNPSSIRVHAPTSVIFLCGGERAPLSPKPASIRDAFYRLTSVSGFRRHHIVLAEDVNAFFPGAEYRDLLSFEADIAQVTQCVLLFCESAGSLAELGAFCALPEVCPNLLVFIDDYFYNQTSFVKLGPLQYLEQTRGEHTVCVLDRDEFGIGPRGQADEIDLDALQARMEELVLDYISKKEEFTKFDRNKRGHIIKLIVGLVQEYGALNLQELKTALSQLEVQTSHIDVVNFLHCATAVKWITKRKVGNQTFYSANVDESAIEFTLVSGSLIKSKLRWRVDIREYWKHFDKPRFRCIVARDNGSQQ